MIAKKDKATSHNTSNTCACGENCTCGCKCASQKMIIKSGVTLASAILISGAILTAGYEGTCTKDTRTSGLNVSETAIHDYIVKNPKVLIDTVSAYYEALDRGNAAQGDAKAGAPAPQATADKALVDKIVKDKTNHVLGNPNGKFIIIEFFDYQCGWCKRTNVALGDAVKSAEGKNIRWILIDTPIFGEASEQISRFALAAGKQGKFKEYHEAIMAAKGKLDKPALVKIGTDLKLNTKKLVADAEGKEIAAKMAENQKYARQLNINGVPMLIVDGKINPGALLGDNLAAAVKASNEKK